ncbi:diguanylate cyclase [Alteromonas sp. 1_MG-2023]|uniref:GGDEF domain-containing protein n=1 Tax=Alteromonas sp. 1_MG-2023 TaxID=3062669 RepID=UPI0026E28A30|nr:sensor domain-containing diguanylate cyclase [Alteromonas sp. 1_MG-2023]MDO6567553.1 diguanylate cyclase [Alteromonas sp. 1_MG-2023]
MFTLRNATQFSHHKGWLLFTSAAIALACFLSLTFGNAKSIAIISGLDIVGEGSVVLLTLGWVLAVLASRPPGKVTSLLVVGLVFFLFSMFLDLLDEFMKYPDSALWLSMIESIPAAIGMVVMTAALYLWHLEQRAINLQLRRREWDYRDHEEIDPITQLYRGDYWQSRVASLQEKGEEGFVAIIDINEFSYFNQRYGQAEGDRYLHEVAQLVVMNLRQQDLACRYAGDRFALLLPNVNAAQANDILKEIRISIGHVAFRYKSDTAAIYTSARAVVAPLNQQSSLSSTLLQLLAHLENAERNAA